MMSEADTMFKMAEEILFLKGKLERTEFMLERLKAENEMLKGLNDRTTD